MPSTRLIGAIAAGSFGLGALLGSNKKEISLTLEHIKTGSVLEKAVPRVFASTLIPYDRKNVQTQPPNSSTGKLSPEVMRFGFPSYENLRTFDDFVLSYDKRNKNANWVFEHLTKDKVTKAPGINRDDSQFISDDKIHEYFRATNEDFKKSGYDRGHLAAAGNHRWSQKALDETFHLSNISPQVGKGFNRDAWNTLEMFVRHLTKEYKNVYVCTGPLYLPKRETDGKLYITYEVIGKNHVSVPTHFFKVAVCESPAGQLDMFSFVMPNRVISDVDLKNFMVPVDSIERAAGFLLFDRINKNNFKKINGRAV